MKGPKVTQPSLADVHPAFKTADRAQAGYDLQSSHAPEEPRTQEGQTH